MIAGTLNPAVSIRKWLEWQPCEITEDLPKSITVIDAIQALDNVCDGATSKDKAGFGKFDLETFGDIIDKAVSEGELSPKEERKAYNFLKKYKKQLKGLGINYDEIGHINATGCDDEKESAAASLVKLVTESGAELWHTSKQEFYAEMAIKRLIL